MAAELVDDDFRRVTDAREELVDTLGVCLIGQTARIAPADKRLYSLRDVTATVESLPLIASSIMSTKLAEGIDGLVLDCKVGRGALLRTVGGGRARVAPERTSRSRGGNARPPRPVRMPAAGAGWARAVRHCPRESIPRALALARALWATSRSTMLPTPSR